MSVIYDPSKTPTEQQPVAKSKSPKRARPKVKRPAVLLPSVTIPTIPWRLLSTLIALVVIIGGVAYGAMSLTGEKTVQAPTGTQLVQPEKVYLTTDDAATDTTIDLSFVALKSWATHQEGQPQTPPLSGGDYTVGQFSGNAGQSPVSLTVENVTNWLTTGTKGDSYRSLVQPADKQKYIQYLDDLRAKRTVPSDYAASVPPLENESGDRSSVRYLNSADGKLSGILYVATLEDNGVKKPYIIADIAGKVSDQTVLARLQAPAGNDSKLTDETNDLLKSLTLQTARRDRKILTPAQ